MRRLVASAACVALRRSAGNVSAASSTPHESTVAEAMRQLHNLRLAVAAAIAKRQPAIDHMFGITSHVAAAHVTIQKAEERFAVSQQEHRAALSDLAAVQRRLKQIHAQVDKTSRGDPKYMQLLRHEHEAVTHERHLMQLVQSRQTAEMKHYALFAAALRHSQTDELRRAQHIKTLTLAGAAVGLAIGALVAGGAVALRRRPVVAGAVAADAALPSLMVVTTPGAATSTRSAAGDRAPPPPLAADHVNTVVTALQGQITEFVGSLSSLMSYRSPVGLPQLHVAGSDDARARAQITLHHDMTDVLKAVAADRGYMLAKDGSTLVLSGAGGETTSAAGAVDADTARFKLRVLLYVVAVYAALALTAPVVYGLLKG